MLGANITSGIGGAVYVAVLSAIYKKNLKPGLGVLGNISIGGAIERAINFVDNVSMLSENGAKNVIIIDRNNWLGGILPQCIHDGFGVEETGKSMTGPEYAEKYIKQAKKRGIKETRVASSLTAFGFYKKLGYKRIKKINIDVIGDIIIMKKKI